MLLNDTLTELESWKIGDAYSWLENLRSAKQQMENWKQERTQIVSKDERCWRELYRRIKRMFSNPSYEDLLDERFQKVSVNTKTKPKEATPPKKHLSDWWTNAGISVRSKIPAYCLSIEDTNKKRYRISVELMHDLLSHI